MERARTLRAWPRPWEYGAKATVLDDRTDVGLDSIWASEGRWRKRGSKRLGLDIRIEDKLLLNDAKAHFVAAGTCVPDVYI